MKIPILIFSFVVFGLQHNVYCQTEPPAKMNRDKPMMVDQFVKVGSEDRSARLDQLLVELQDNPGSRGVIYFYCGRVCYYGEYEAHVRGILEKLDNRAFDISRITIMNAGYKNRATTELWRISKNGDFPSPTNGLKFRDVKFKKKGRRFEPYDCCD